MKRTLHKTLSMLLTAAMVLNMGLTPVFAEGVPLGASGLTECHTAHDSECGYTETVGVGGCTHEHTKECYLKELTCVLVEGQAPEIGTDSNAPADEAHSHSEDCYTQTECQHEHSGTCGYTPDSPCTFDPASCEQCNTDGEAPAEKVCTCPPVDSASDIGHGKDCPLYTAPECTCGAVDSGELVHGKDCPLYAPPELSEAVMALIAMVDALPNAADITEENKVATKPAYEAAAMAYEALSDADKAVFEATEQYKKLMALHGVLYGIAMMADSPVTLDITDPSNYVNITATGYKVGTATEIPYTGDYIITGTATSTAAAWNHVTVSGGTHNITLKDAAIQLSVNDKCAFVLEGSSRVNLTLEGENALKSGTYRAGLEVATGNTITIGGAGTVTATGGSYGAGIGGGGAGAGGTITISDNAVVFATKGEYAPKHIGEGEDGAVGTVNRNGGIIFEGAAGKLYAANITPTASFTIPSAHTLTINVNQTLTINSGITVTNNGIIVNRGTINGDGTITGNPPILSTPITHDIGTSDLILDSNCGGGICAGHTVTGTTDTNKIIVESGTHDVTLDGVSINVSTTNFACAFEIADGAAVNLTLANDNILKSGWDKAGLQASTNAELVITAASTGSLTATGGGGIGGGAGIGGGNYGDGGTITVVGGTVTATGGENGAGIGGGNYGAGGTITISDNAVVFATKGEYALKHIGEGDGGTEGTVNRNGGIIFEGDSGKLYGTNATPNASFTIPDTHALTIATGQTLTVNSGITATNNGTITNAGTLKALGNTGGTGTLTGSGRIQIGLTDSMITLPQSSFAYSGKPIVPTVEVAPVALWGKTITFAKDTDYTVTGSDNTAAGTAAKVIVTPMGGDTTLGGAGVEKNFTITAADSALTLTTNKADNIFTYGDTINFTANVSIAPSKARATAINTVEFFCNGKSLGTANLTESGGRGTAEFANDTAKNAIPLGTQTITAEYGGGNLNRQTGTITVTLKEKPSGGGDGDSGGNSGNGGSSSGSTSTSPPTNADAKVPASVDKNGNATATVKEQDIADAIKKAQNAADKNGIAVNIKLESNKAINSFAVTLPKAVQKQLVEAKVRAVIISNGNLSITFDLEVIKQIKATANTDVVVTATKTANSALSKEAQVATGGRPVYDFKVTGGGKNITTFGTGKISLSIPYPLQKVDGNGKPSKAGSFENPGNLVGVYIDASGKLTYLPGSSYNVANKAMLINTNHLSLYGVGYKQNTPKFTDTATHWAKDDIQFVAARGLLTGTTATTFSPNTFMTRGMFVTALGRLAGVDPNSYKTGSFTDVPATAYYAPYVNWAVKNNIVTGWGATTFAPDSAITRQEMAQFMANYAEAMGYIMPKTRAAITFADNSSITSDAVKTMQMAGVIMGKDGNRFDPTGTATRAEGSAMLRRFVELVANSETAEGWVTNDSGNWMYFEDGKAVKASADGSGGKKNIGGTTYEFDRYGVTAILPKDRRFTVYTVQKGDSFWAIASKYKVNIFELVSLNGKNIFSTIHPGDELKIPQA